MDNHVLLPFTEARKHILDGDILLYRGRQYPSSRMINIAGRSPYYHAAMAGWVDKGKPVELLMCYEMVLRGARGTSLAAQVEKYPKQIDVYRLVDECRVPRFDCDKAELVYDVKRLDREKAVFEMRKLCKPNAYGILHVLASALFHIPFCRIFMKPITDDEQSGWSRKPHCSEAVAMAVRSAFMDMVPNMPDHLTIPGDLGRSPLARYVFTLDIPAA
jgi:hypothetical protein